MHVEGAFRQPPEGFRYWRNERADYLRRVGTVVIFGMAIISGYRFFCQDPVTAVYPALAASAVGFTIGIADLFLEQVPPQAPRNLRHRVHPIFGG